MGTEALMSKGNLANEVSNAEGALLLHLVIQVSRNPLNFLEKDKICNIHINYSLNKEIPRLFDERSNWENNFQNVGTPELSRSDKEFPTISVEGLIFFFIF